LVENQTVVHRTSWDISRSGTDTFTLLFSSKDVQTAAVGRFNDQPGADLLFWNNTIDPLGKVPYLDNRLFTGKPGTQTATPHSREDMR